MTYKYKTRFQVRPDLERQEDGTYTRKPAFTVLAFIEADLEAIGREIGEKAFANRSGKSRFMGGKIKCTEVRREP